MPFSSFVSCQKDRFLQEVLTLSRKEGKKVYLVGGYVRDLLLGRETKDYDFVVGNDALTFAKDFAASIGGSFFPLDEEHGTARVVVREGGVRYELDFAKLQGQEIYEDLSRRDFTIDSMAVEVEAIGIDLASALIDPGRGRKDLSRGIIRVVSERAFSDDPLRMIRGVRLAALLSFKIERETRSLIRKQSELILEVSPERIRDELFKILSVPSASNYIKELDQLKLLSQVIPEVLSLKKDGGLGFWEHSLRTLSYIERILAETSFLEPDLLERIRNHLNREIAGERRREELLKLVALLHDLGKPETMSRDKKGRVRFFGHEEKGAEAIGSVATRLKLSQKEIKLAKLLVKSHMRPGNLSCLAILTRRAIYRFFRDLGEAAIEVLFLSLADVLASKGTRVYPFSKKKHKETISLLLQTYFEEISLKKLPWLVRGKDLIESFGLSPGPLIGKLLEEIKEAQVEGRVKTKKQALEYAKSILKKKGEANL